MQEKSGSWPKLPAQGKRLPESEQSCVLLRRTGLESPLFKLCWVMTTRADNSDLSPDNYKVLDMPWAPRDSRYYPASVRCARIVAREVIHGTAFCCILVL